MVWKPWVKKEAAPVAEQPFDIDRVLELVSDDVHERIAELKQSVAAGGGRFTPEDNNLIEQLTEEIEAMATTRGMVVTEADRDLIDRYIRTAYDQPMAA